LAADYNCFEYFDYIYRSWGTESHSDFYAKEVVVDPYEGEICRYKLIKDRNCINNYPLSST